MSDQGSQQPEIYRAKGAGHGKGWVKGQSGNPSGRPKGIESLAREYTPRALEALALALNEPSTRVPAAVALLDRGWGKPKQTIAGDEENPVSVIALHLLAARSISSELAKHPVTVDAVVDTDTNVSTGGKLNGHALANLLNAPPPEE